MSRVRSTKLEMHEFSFSVLAMLVVSSVSLSEKELHIEKKQAIVYVDSPLSGQRSSPSWTKKEILQERKNKDPHTEFMWAEVLSDWRLFICREGLWFRPNNSGWLLLDTSNTQHSKQSV